MVLAYRHVGVKKWLADFVSGDVFWDIIVIHALILVVMKIQILFRYYCPITAL